MSNQKQFKHLRHVGYLSYPISTAQRIYSAIVTPLLSILFLVVVLKLFSVSTSVPTGDVSWINLGMATLATFLRLLIAYVLALAVAIPLAIIIYKRPALESILLPLFDIVQSIPVLAFFPVVILVFIKLNFFDGAAIFILFLSMVWNIVFSIVGGMKVIPGDIKSAAKVFNIRGFDFIHQIFLPAVFPSLVTGSLLAWAQGWNVVIVAEVLHTYIPGGTSGQDLFGIGSTLVYAAASGQQNVFVSAVLCIIFIITLLNLFVWQRLLNYAEKYRFE